MSDTNEDVIQLQTILKCKTYHTKDHLHLILGYSEIARNQTFVSVWGLRPQTPALEIACCCNQNSLQLAPPLLKTLLRLWVTPVSLSGDY